MMMSFSYFHTSVMTDWALMSLSYFHICMWWQSGFWCLSFIFIYVYDDGVGLFTYFQICLLWTSVLWFLPLIFIHVFDDRVDFHVFPLFSYMPVMTTEMIIIMNTITRLLKVHDDRPRHWYGYHAIHILDSLFWVCCLVFSDAKNPKYQILARTAFLTEDKSFIASAFFMIVYARALNISSIKFKRFDKKIVVEFWQKYIIFIFVMGLPDECEHFHRSCW